MSNFQKGDLVQCIDDYECNVNGVPALFGGALYIVTREKTYGNVAIDDSTIDWFPRRFKLIKRANEILQG